nr:hypothetical protein [uncultured Oscillibacter sp.]
MKRSLTLLLASLLLAFSLAACGGDNKQDTNQNGSAVTSSDNANGNGTDNATDDRTDSNGTNGGSLAEDAGNAVTDGIDDVGDALTGDNAQNGTANKTRSTGGATYGQMLRNGRVHDRDGDLTDGENSVTRGAMF